MNGEQGAQALRRWAIEWRRPGKPRLFLTQRFDAAGCEFMYEFYQLASARAHADRRWAESVRDMAAAELGLDLQLVELGEVPLSEAPEEPTA